MTAVISISMIKIGEVHVLKEVDDQRPKEGKSCSDEVDAWLDAAPCHTRHDKPSRIRQEIDGEVGREAEVMVPLHSKHPL